MIAAALVDDNIELIACPVVPNVKYTFPNSSST